MVVTTVIFNKIIVEFYYISLMYFLWKIGD